MKKVSKLWFSIAVAALAVFNVLFFYSIHAMWSGIIAILGTASPYVLISIMFLLAVFTVLMLLGNKRMLIPTIIAAVISLFFFVVCCYVLSVTFDSIKYFVREFAIGLGFTALIALFVYILFYFPKTKLFQSKSVKLVLVFVLIFGIFFSYFDVSVNRFDSTPVVYAVEDNYQIVFTTTARSTAWVEIDGVEYNASYAGYRTSEDRVHKVTVPMDKLDNAKSYTINSRAMILRGPYSAFQGHTKSKEYNWRGVDNDGEFNYYVLSDTHTEYLKPIAAGGYFGDKLDLLICCGDTANWLDTGADVAYGLKIMGGITKGEIPVVYARGNHETKGLIADELYKYVGSVNEKFYYTFRLKNVWGVVLDLGEDHADDWKEFYDASRFDEYRAEQTEFLDGIIADKDNEYDAEGVDYRIAVCHMPITFMYRNDDAKEYKEDWIERLNQMKLTMCYGGHRHQLMYVDKNFEAGQELTYYKGYAGYDGSKPDGYATDANFSSVLVSRKSSVQTITVKEQFFNKCFIGLAVTNNGSTTTMKFTDDKGKIVEVASPWFADINYGEQIVVDNVD